MLRLCYLTWILLFRYIPPLLWGKSGHLQTALYGKMGRVNTPTPCGVRKFLTMQDGATSTFDLFEARGDHSTGGEKHILVYLVKQLALDLLLSVILLKFIFDEGFNSYCFVEMFLPVSPEFYVLVWIVSTSSSCYSMLEDH